MPCRPCELTMALRITHHYTRSRCRYPHRYSGRPRKSPPRHRKDTHPTLITLCRTNNRCIRILRDIPPMYNPWTICGAQPLGSVRLNGLISKTRLGIYKVLDFECPLFTSPVWLAYLDVLMCLSSILLPCGISVRYRPLDVCTLISSCFWFERSCSILL